MIYGCNLIIYQEMVWPSNQFTACMHAYRFPWSGSSIVIVIALTGSYGAGNWPAESLFTRPYQHHGVSSLVCALIGANLMCWHLMLLGSDNMCGLSSLEAATTGVCRGRWTPSWECDGTAGCYSMGPFCHNVCELWPKSVGCFSVGIRYFV